MFSFFGGQIIVEIRNPVRAESLTGIIMRACANRRRGRVVAAGRAVQDADSNVYKRMRGRRALIVKNYVLRGRLQRLCGMIRHSLCLRVFAHAHA